MKSPSPPQPPDPYKTSAADQQGHTGTAIAQTWLNNANEYTPFGNVTYDRTGTQYTKDAQGNQIEVPTFTRQTTLSDAEQQKYDLENRVATHAGTIAEQQLGRLQDSLGQPIDLNGLPARAANLPQAPTFGSMPGGPQYQGLAGGLPQYQDWQNVQQASAGWVPEGDYGAYRDRAEGALRQRLSPQLDQQQRAMETQLANQGVRAGSEAYREAMALAGRQRNDAELGIIGQAGQEVDRAFGMDQARFNDRLGVAGFNNQANQGQLAFNNAMASQRFGDEQTAAGFNNSVLGQQYADAMTALQYNNQMAGQQYQYGVDAAEFQNNNRERALQEQLAVRNQPINEISALMGQSQVNMPQFQQYQGGRIQPTSVADNVYRSAAIEQQNYQAKLQSRNAMMGGLFSLGGSLMKLPFMGL